MYNNETDNNTLLQFLLNQNNICIDDVLQEIEMNKNLEILNKHKEQHKVWQSNGNKPRWYTYLPDETKDKGIRLIAKTSEDSLNRTIIEYYKSLDSTDRMKNISLESLYLEWLDYKALHTNSSTYIRRIDNDWNKYYKDTYIVKIPIIQLDYLSLEKWSYSIIKENQLTRKCYTNMQTIIRQELQLAVEKGLIESSPYDRIKIPQKLFKPVANKKDFTQVFLVEEEPLIIQEAYNDFIENNNTSALAIALLFETGMRAGELLGLKFSDIDSVKKNYIHICHSEVRVEHKNNSGKWLPATYEIVSHTKTLAGIRDIYLTENARKIIQMVKDWNIANGFKDSEYIFMNINKGKTHIRQIDYRIRKYCNHLKICEKSLHKIRKTYISTLIDSNIISINTIKTLVGHTDARTTYNSYVYSRKNDQQTEADLEAVLKKTI